jgi:DNA polymerase eta
MCRQGLIAINYPAREAGIGRHCDVTEAKKLCPELIAQHVATWREGDDKWAYRDDAAANIAKDKVSLDPYRLQSRRILALVKESLPADKQKVEKASIDEVFLDLSAHIHSLLLERFPELSGPPPYDDPSEKLPLPSIAALDWQADALIDLDEDQEALDPDWDDVAILLGSEIVRDIRAKVREKLHYTCSGGIAQNKLVSKLGSGFKKPNRQTVVRSRAVQSFLEGFKVTKFRNLGGKLGEQVVSNFGTESVKELLQVPLDQMKSKLGEETGQWLHNTIRGIDTSEVNSRTQIKSMLSAKSFRPTISSPDQAIKWLRIFVADIFARLVEEGVLENRRRPRSIILHHRYAGQPRAQSDPRRLETRSRGEAIPSGKMLDEDLLFRLAKDLLGQIAAEDRTWPCSNLSLSVSGFEEGVKGNMGIGAFLVRGEDAEILRQATPESRPAHDDGQQQNKKRRVEEAGIKRFFGRGDSASEELDPQPHAGRVSEATTATMFRTEPADDNEGRVHNMSHPALVDLNLPRDWVADDILTCPRCQAAFDDAEQLQSHGDWHMAKDLQDEERVRPVFATGGSASLSATSSRGSGMQQKRGGRGGRGRGRGGKTEQGQRKLNFG